MKTPLLKMKEQFGSKDKLVESVLSALKNAGKTVDGLKERLQKQSNLKLMKLLDRYGKAKKE